MSWRAAPMLGARDVQRTADWYCDVLGFECPGGVIQGVGDEPAIYAVLRRDGSELHVQIRRHQIWPEGRRDVERSAYLRVSDVDALHEELLGKGAAIAMPPTDMPYGMREIVIEDPEGHRIAFGAGEKLSGWVGAPVLGTRDVVAATDWYCKCLGFACPGGVYGGVGDEPPVYAIVSRGGAEVHLQIRRRPLFVGKRESIEGDAYLFVDDVNALYGEYAGGGVRILREPMDEPYGLRDFTIEDADGHRLTLGTPL